MIVTLVLLIGLLWLCRYGRKHLERAEFGYEDDCGYHSGDKQ